MPSSEGCPLPPDWLGERGKEEWSHVAPLLHAVGCLTDVDCSLLSQYCQAWDDFFVALEDVRKNGVKAVGSNGNDISNPAFKAKYDASALIVKIAVMFGMSPTSRVGISGAPQDAGFDDLEQFKAGTA
jgi:P27 family predicted phage terminase small subunit